MTTMAIFTTTLKLNDETFIIQERSDDGIIRCTWETLDGSHRPAIPRSPSTAPEVNAARPRCNGATTDAVDPRAA
jgi:hypothetical protein